MIHGGTYVYELFCFNINLDWIDGVCQGGLANRLGLEINELISILMMFRFESMDFILVEGRVSLWWLLLGCAA